MEEGGVQARYVKLTRKQAEVIRPGELNQAIHVPQLHRKCSECRQPLPERFVFPKDEPWTTGIFGCAEDTESCWTGLLCPCVLFGRNVQRIRDDANCIGPCMCHAVVIEGGIALAAATAAFYGFDPSTSLLICEGLLFSWGICGLYTGLFRQWLQRKYHLKVTSISYNQKKRKEKELTVWPVSGALLHALVCLVPRTPGDERTSL
ncbi:cell number regulator 6-like isoform X2 [Rhododendron vialii]|uniref:cell number regulator 6-like isoform X2 n=1 Tax=Rhododendron vialii TaxID=182163 RepID=UPI0026603C4D|nr:cell number regulator 6-like isoform X2 [Rhododendron vialii]